MISHDDPFSGYGPPLIDTCLAIHAHACGSHPPLDGAWLNGAVAWLRVRVEGGWSATSPRWQRYDDAVRVLARTVLTEIERHLANPSTQGRCPGWCPLRRMTLVLDMAQGLHGHHCGSSDPMDTDALWQTKNQLRASIGSTLAPQHCADHPLDEAVLALAEAALAETNIDTSAVFA